MTRAYYIFRYRIISVGRLLRFAILLLIVLQSSDFRFRTHPSHLLRKREAVNNFKRLWLMSIEKLASRLLNSIIHHQENLFVWSILLTQKNCTTSTIVLPVWIQLFNVHTENYLHTAWDDEQKSQIYWLPLGMHCIILFTWCCCVTQYDSMLLNNIT